MNDSVKNQLQILKNLLHVLRDDGVAYVDILLKLMQLVLIKMAEEDEDLAEKFGVDVNYYWSTLVNLEGSTLIRNYRKLLMDMSQQSNNTLSTLYDGSVGIQHPKTLERLIYELDRIDWVTIRDYGFLTIYQDLLSVDEILINRVILPGLSKSTHAQRLRLLQSLLSP